MVWDRASAVFQPNFIGEPIPVATYNHVFVERPKSTAHLLLWISFPVLIGLVHSPSCIM